MHKKFGNKKITKHPFSSCHYLADRSFVYLKEKSIQLPSVCLSSDYFAIKDVVYGENYVMHQVLVLDIDSLLEGPLIYMSTLDEILFLVKCYSKIILLCVAVANLLKKCKIFHEYTTSILTRKCKFPGDLN